MEFALSEDQRLLQDSIKGFLDSAAPLDTVREIAGGEAAKTAELERGLAELGLAQALVPETYGGLGLGVLDAALIQEALGRAIAPSRFTATAMATVGVLTAGTEAQKQALLPKIASSEARFGVAITEHVGAREGAGVHHAVGRLTGRALFALDVETATHLVIVDTDGRLHITPAETPGLSRATLTSIDKTRSLSELVFENVEAEWLSGETENEAADRVIQVGRVLLAADTLGAADAMLEKAIAYAKERKQFKRVIGSFQSVKHLCAEMAAELEPARALVWHAAYAQDVDPKEAPLMACLAKSHLAEIGTFIARAATEVHGGMGFTDLLGLHYWFKRIGLNRQLFGGPERVREEAARLQGWAA